MTDPQISLTVVVAGVDTTVVVNPHSPLRTVIPEALRLSGNVGQPPENWVLKDVKGNELDIAKKIEDYGFTATTKLYLSLRAGIGG